MTTALSGSLATAYAQTGPIASDIRLANNDPVSTVDGMKVVNIAAPDSAGVSRNLYSSFTIGEAGAILNNSLSEANSVALGRRIAGNPNLASGNGATGVVAKLIVNEVENARAIIGGGIEVLGGKAAVVIASPQGITCSACGFINVSNVALAVATPVYNGTGNLTGFDTSGNPTGASLEIINDGLYATDVDYFDLVSGKVTVNGQIFGKDVVISAGDQTFNYADRTAEFADRTSAVTALDSTALGGMYVNKIRIIAGGRNNSIDLKGQITSAKDDISISAGQDIKLPQLTSFGSTIIEAQSGVDLSKNISAKKDVTIKAPNINHIVGNVTADGAIQFASEYDPNGTGRFLSSNRYPVINLNRGQFVAKNAASLTSTVGVIINANANITVSADRGLLKIYAPTVFQDSLSTIKADLFQMAPELADQTTERFEAIKTVLASLSSNPLYDEYGQGRTSITLLGRTLTRDFNVLAYSADGILLAGDVVPLRSGTQSSHVFRVENKVSGKLHIAGKIDTGTMTAKASEIVFSSDIAAANKISAYAGTMTLVANTSLKSARDLYI